MRPRFYRAPKLVQIALRLFPAPFRARYGPDLWQCIRDARRDLGNENISVTIRFWFLVLADLGRSALIEWCRSISRESWSLALRRTAGAALIASALANVAYDAVSIKLSMGFFAAFLTAVAAVTGSLLVRSGPGNAR
ncbi:MAG: hypothetical protein M3O61_18105 [Gemmatimonadota bacterium]|nr:hypothetical protein [Gemmatimonadota bacterium]